jgi:hypothetical protein
MLLGGLIWLASYPKSGNTWARNFLHNLLDEEPGVGARAGDGYDINRMGRVTTIEMAADWYAPHLDKPVAECGYAELAAVRMKAQGSIAATSKDLIFVKTHNFLGVENGIPLINSKVTAGAVYIVRNPLDVAISFRHHMGLGQDEAIETMADPKTTTKIHEVASYEVYGSWSLNVESWTRKPQRTLFVMRYEDMLEKPLETFGALARWLKQPATKAQLEAAIEASSFERLKAQEDEKGFKEKPKHAERFFREGRSGQWRDVLSEDQVRRIVADHRTQMARFGYVPEGY